MGKSSEASGTRRVVRSFHAVERSRLPPKAGAGKRDSLIAPNAASPIGIKDNPIPNHFTDGHSQVVDLWGRVLAEAGQGETMNGYAEIDIGALRRCRAKPAMSNTLARQRLELLEHVYAGQSVYPANTLLDGGKVRSPGRRHYLERHYLDTQQSVIDSLKERGVI